MSPSQPLCTHPSLRSLASDGICPLCPIEAPQELQLSREQAIALLAEANKELARKSFAEFVKQAWAEIESQPLEWGHGPQAICDNLQMTLEYRQKAIDDPTFDFSPYQNFLINVPPRNLKTTIISICFPAWAWLRWPGLRFLCLSGNPSVSLESGDKCRLLVESHWYRSFGGPELRKDKDAKSNFGNAAGGSRMSLGFDSKFQGLGGDVLLCDDPHDASDVHSDLKREHVNSRWKSTISTRVNNPRTALRIGIMQRLHCDDWAGHRISEGWATLIIPMEFETNGPSATPNVFGWQDWRTQDGELIHPRFTPGWLAQTKETLGSFGVAGQFQQRPFPLGGGLFKADWFPRFEDAPTSFDRLVISVDAAFKETGTSDFVSCLVIGSKALNRFVIDNVTRRMGFTETLNTIRALKAKYPAVSKIYIEDKANGSAAVEVLSKEMNGIVALNPLGGKESRAAAISPQVESQRVWIPKFAPWADAFIGELCSFPNGAHDDQVDALSQALIEMTKKKNPWDNVTI